MKESRLMTEEQLAHDEARALRRSLHEESLYKRERYSDEEKAMYRDSRLLFQMKFFKHSLRTLAGDLSMTIRPKLIHEFRQSIIDFITPIFRDAFLFAVERDRSRMYDATTGKKIDASTEGPMLWWKTVLLDHTASSSEKNVTIFECDVLAALDKYEPFLYQGLSHLRSTIAQDVPSSPRPTDDVGMSDSEEFSDVQDSLNGTSSE